MAKATIASPTRATQAATAAGIPFTVHRYRHDPRNHNFGSEAVAALAETLALGGRTLDPAQVLKSLVIRSDDTLAVAVLPVPSSLDLKAAAAALGGRRSEMATVHDAQRATGYVTGGISPLGTRHVLPTVLSSRALDFATVFCSAGQRGVEIELDPRDLVTLAAAVVAECEAKQ